MHSAAATTSIFAATSSPRLSPTLRSMSSQSSFASAHSNASTAPFSLNAMMLAPETAAFSRPAFGGSRTHTRACSISSSAATSTTCSYGREELDRERELFGESAMGLFEPRDQVMGFWGMTEVLRGEHQ